MKEEGREVGRVKWYILSFSTETKFHFDCFKPAFEE